MVTCAQGVLTRRLAAAAMSTALALLVGAPAVSATSPPEHIVTICHATSPDTAAGGWVTIDVDVASVGYQQEGHESEHDADIIPPYAYADVVFEGKNWDATGQATWANDCTAAEPTVAPTEVATATPTGEPTATATATPTPAGAVLPATGVPNVTLPPTDHASAPGTATLPLGLIVGIAALISLGALTIARRPSDRAR